MITPVVREKKKLSSVRCVLCQSKSNFNFKIKKIGMSFRIVCEDCSNTFSDKEMELIHNMFTAFGGNFGLLSNSKEASYLKLKEIAEDYKALNKDVANIENDVKTLHLAFLYGITPKQLVQGLKFLID